MRKLPANKLHAKHWMIVDNFAGGGGASTGIEWAVGRSPDAAINHDPEALAMHEANHPRTRHYATDVFEIDPQVVVRDKPVGLAWFSPDFRTTRRSGVASGSVDHGAMTRSAFGICSRGGRLIRKN